MGAIAQIDEYNGAGQILTAAVSNSNVGSLDAPNLDPVGNFIVPGQPAFEKWQKIHFTNLNGLSKVNNFKVYRTGALGGATVHKTNLQNPPVNTPYATPKNTISNIATQLMPTSPPASENIGAGGQTYLGAPGTTDFIVHQLQTNVADINGAISQMNYIWDEIA